MEPETQPPTNGEERKRAPRSDRGLPKRRTLTLSRAASARFARVAAALPGGEKELEAMLEPIVERLFNGDLHDRVVDDTGDAIYRPVGPLHELALQAQRARMIGGADE